MSTDDRTNEPSDRHPDAGDAVIPQYEIRVQGHLGTRWAAWFDGMALTDEADGTTVLHGSVVDQAALHGLLQKLRDLGITLLSLTPIDPDPAIDRGPAIDPGPAIEQPDPSQTHTRNPHHAPGATS